MALCDFDMRRLRRTLTYLLNAVHEQHSAALRCPVPFSYDVVNFGRLLMLFLLLLSGVHLFHQHDKCGSL